MTTEEHYVQGGLDYQFVGKTYDQRLECSICLLCLRNPHQTSCGHRFCYSCILAWLNEGKSCPHDNASLGEGKKVVQKKVPLYGKKCIGVQWYFPRLMEARSATTRPADVSPSDNLTFWTLALHDVSPLDVSPSDVSPSAISPLAICSLLWIF